MSIEEIELSENEWFTGEFKKDFLGDYYVTNFDAWIRFNEDDFCLTSLLTVDQLKEYKEKAVEIYTKQENERFSAPREYDAEYEMEVS